MSDCYEWFDPFEAKQEAVRWKSATLNAEERGRRSVLRQLSGEAGRKVAYGIQEACGVLGEKIARDTVFPLAAREAYASMLGRSEVVANEFRRACEKVSSGIDWPSRGSVDIDIQGHISDMETTMTIRYQTIEPIRVAFGFRL